MEYLCVNGTLVRREKAVLPVTDRAFLYGYGLFETMRIAAGRALFLEEHLDRLEKSGAELGLGLPDRDSVIKMVTETTAANAVRDGSLRLTVTAGSQPESRGENPEVSVVVAARQGVPYPGYLYQRGFQAGILDTRRNEKSPLVRLKTLNYLENILGRREAARRGWDEGLFLNTAGFLSEGTVSNLFLVEAEALLTPSVESGILPGVVRKKVLELASANGIDVYEKAIPPEKLKSAREAFLTNSLLGVMPLVSVDGGEIFTGCPGPWTKKIMEFYSRLCREENSW